MEDATSRTELDRTGRARRTNGTSLGPDGARKRLIRGFGDMEAKRGPSQASGVKIDAVFPNYVDTHWRISKEASDLFARCLRALALGLALALLVLASIKPLYGDDAWTVPLFSSALLGLPLVLMMLVVVRNRDDLLIDEAIRVRNEERMLLARRLSNSRAVRFQGLVFRLSAYIGVLMFYLGVSMGAVRNRPGSVLLGATLLLPILISYRFSRRLLREGVTDLDYIKGTAVGREILVYWMVATLVSFQRTFAPNLIFTVGNIGEILISALSLAALTRVASSGYADFHDALDKSRARRKGTQNAP